jgi:hypothetical protein
MVLMWSTTAISEADSSITTRPDDDESAEQQQQQQRETTSVSQACFGVCQCMELELLAQCIANNGGNAIAPHNE